MRVTVDKDSNNPLAWAKCFLLGTYHCKRPPSMFRRTSKGVHIIWSGMDISNEKSMELRKKIGDDENRCRLDEASDRRIKNVLFSEKTITCNGFLLASSCKRVGINPEGRDLSKCPKCGQKIGISLDIREEGMNRVEVYHKHYSFPCVFKPKRRLL